VFQPIRLKTVLFILVLCIPLFACLGSDPAVVEESIDTTKPTTSSENASSSEAIRSSGTPVTNIDQIVGMWIGSANPEIFYLLIHSDGTVKVAPSLNDMESGSTNTWMMKIEENQIITDKFSLCLGDIGTYFGEINNDGSLKFTTISDPCSYRLRHLDRSLPGRMTDYNLLYIRVE